MKNFLAQIGGAVRDYFIKTDKMLLFMAITLSVFSCLMQYSLASIGAILMSTFYRHVIFSAIGIVAAIVISLFDYHYLVKLWKIFAPVVIILMILLLFTPLGTKRAGDGMGSDDLNWLSIGPLPQFQPSELLKLAFILTFSYHLSKVRDHLNSPKTILLIMLHAAVPIGLMAKSGDSGTLLVFICIFLSIIFTAGLNWKYMLAGGTLAPIAGFVYWQFILDNAIKKRFNFSQEYILANAQGDTYQQYWGQITLGSGELTGKGLFSEDLITTTPELHNDYIFAHVGQALGFVGCAILILWVAVICVKIITNARAANDPLGNHICVGVFAIFFFQSVINIGMVLCVLPVIGITMPLVSAGGTSIITTYMALGLVLSVHNNTRKDDLF